MSGEVQLSKWWRTPSAQAAFKRAEEARKAKLEKLKATVKARKEQIARDVENWKEQT